MAESKVQAIRQANRFRGMTPEKRRAYMAQVAGRCNREDGSAPRRMRWLDRLVRIDVALTRVALGGGDHE